jgi:tetratricopeptide (TPR) repeat protein
MDKDSTLSATDWFNEGLKCFNKPDGIAAVRAFEAVVKIDPAYRHGDGDNPYFYLGKISEMEGRIDEAILFYSSALTVDLYDEESLIGRGSCYTVKKNHEGAVVDFKKVLEIPPESRNAPVQHVLYAIAENYRQQKDFPRALHWGGKALSEDPGNDRHRKLVAEVKKQMRDVP